MRTNFFIVGALKMAAFAEHSQALSLSENHHQYDLSLDHLLDRFALAQVYLPATFLNSIFGDTVSEIIDDTVTVVGDHIGSSDDEAKDEKTEETKDTTVEPKTQT